MIIDSHCHLDKLDTSHYTDGFAGLIAAAQANDVSQMLCISVDTEKFDPMMAQIAAYDFIHASAGLHPLSVKHLDCLSLLELQAQHPKVVAIGETGLDYFYQQDNAALQQQAFIAHLQLSKRLAKPVIVHTRSANEDTLRLLREEADQDVGGVIHCFTEDWAMAEACLDLGFYISISGIVTFNSANEHLANPDIIKLLQAVDQRSNIIDIYALLEKLTEQLNFINLRRNLNTQLVCEDLLHQWYLLVRSGR